MTVTIIHGRSSCQVRGLDDYDIIKELEEELSFVLQGAEHMNLFKGFEKDGKFTKWDGVVSLLSGNLRFAPGLLSRVERFFRERDIDYVVEDNRPRLTTGQRIDILPKLKASGKTPYPYQLDAVKKAVSVERGIIRIGTGGGKTVVAALIVAEIGKPAVVYVIGKDLLYQIRSLFQSLFDEPIGIIGDGKCEIHRINIATIWSIGTALGLRKQKRVEGEEKEKPPPKEHHKDIKKMLAHTGVHILDECHLAACDTVQGIFKTVCTEHIYGMSASPWRDDGADLLIENYLGEKIVDIGAKYLIDNGYLVKPTIRFLPVKPHPYKSTKSYKRIYSQYIVNNPHRNAMVIKAAQRLVEQGFKTLVLFHTISHGKALYNELSKTIPCEILSGKDNSDERERVKKRLEDGEISLVLASKIFDIGVDLPILNALVTAGGGKSSVRALQRIGRVIRRAPNKEMAAVIDFADQAPYLFSHSEARRDIYSQEFEVKWPKKQEP